MRAPSFKPVLGFFLLLVPVCSTLFCSGYTYLQVGVDSNFLIDDGRVLFAQSDGSLTALSLDSGQVLVRDKTRNYSGALLRTPQGLLVLNDRVIALLNPTTFSALWETTSCEQPNITLDALVSHDGRGLVQCRELETGHIRWSYELPGDLDIVAASGRVLVHRAAVFDEHLVPTTVLLDLQSGKELFRKTAPPGTNRVTTFLDGTNIFVEEGAFKDKRPEYEPERLATWNDRGEEIHSVPIPTESRQDVRDRAIFDLDGKTFWKGHVYANRESIPYEMRGKLPAAAVQTNDVSKTYESTYDLGAGTLFTERAKYLAGKEDEGVAFVMEIELRAPTNHWAGVLSYLMDRGRITAIGRANERILIGTDFGQVECIAAVTGESQWLYVFPTLHRTMSYSSRGLPPTQSEAAAIFRRENANPPISGLHLINGKAGTPCVILDPKPVDPYVNLPRHLVTAWGGAGIALIILVLVHTLPWTRKWGPNALGTTAVWLTFLLFGFYLFYGRVSPASSIALRTTMLIGFISGVLDTVKSFRRGQRIEAAILAVTFAAVGLFIWLALA
jgi:outer membrane protein assembly factor BamB